MINGRLHLAVAAWLALFLIGCGGGSNASAQEHPGTVNPGASGRVLSVVVSGGGSVSSTPAGISCRSDCHAAFADGAAVTLTAHPDAGEVFAGWSGGVCSGNSPTCKVVIKAVQQIAAAFDKPTTAAAPDGACRDFYPKGFALIEGEVTVPWITEAKPVRGVAKRETSFNTCEVRVTDHRKDGIATFERNDYSRRQAFNTDNSRQLVYAYDGSWHLFDTDYKHLGLVPNVAGDAEPQWDPLDPDVLFYLPTNGVGMKLFRRNVSTGSVATVGDFGARLKARWPTANSAWTRSEGSPSADGRYWCFMVDDVLWNGLGFFTWDKQTDTILGMRDLASRPDNVSMSATGDYCVVTAPDTVVYSRDLKTSRLIRPGQEHADIGLTPSGDDAFVSIDYGNGYVFMTNLRTLVRTDLFPTYIGRTASAFHFSGKSFRKPGWFVVSSYAEYGVDGPYTQQWLHRKVMIVQMAANPKIYNLAATQVAHYDGYWTEPQASVNRDMTKIVWTSNWNVDTDLDVDAYMVQIPAASVK